MKILVIDDDLNKMRQLTLFVRETWPDVELVEKTSYQSGLKSALMDRPDLVLLDMTMPTFVLKDREAGGRERRYAGHQILRQLHRKGASSQVVVVTQFEKFGEGSDLVRLDELRATLASEFPQGYLGTIYYQAGDARWKDELKTYVTKCLSLIKSQGAQ